MKGLLRRLGYGFAVAMNIWIIQGYYLSEPVLFWAGTSAFLTCTIICIVYVATHWDMSYNIPKRCLVYTVIGIAISCAIAWINIEYAWIFIVLLGTIDALTVNRFYRLKLKNK
jgi:hypothetical protein